MIGLTPCPTEIWKPLLHSFPSLSGLQGHLAAAQVSAHEHPVPARIPGTCGGWRDVVMSCWRPTSWWCAVGAWGTALLAPEDDVWAPEVLLVPLLNSFVTSSRAKASSPRPHATQEKTKHQAKGQDSYKPLPAVSTSVFTSEEPLKEGMDKHTELRAGSTTRESPTAASPAGSELGGFTIISFVFLQHRPTGTTFKRSHTLKLLTFYLTINITLEEMMYLNMKHN